MSRIPSPDPTELRFHRAIGGPGRYAVLSPGASFDNVTPLYAMVNVAGLERFRIRGLSSGANFTLACRFVRPPENIADTQDWTTQAGLASAFGNAIYTQNQPGDVVFVAGTENMLEVTSHRGEGLAIIRLTGAGAGTLTYLDFMGV